MLLVRFELPVLKRLMQHHDDSEEFLVWANLYSRKSKELLAESQQLAFSLNAWIKDVLRKAVEVKSSLVSCRSMHSCVADWNSTTWMYLRLIPSLF